MKKQKTTLRDIAKAANVSMMSVSRALRGGVGVSGELRTRITRLAEELGYVPNRLSYELGQQKNTMTVGVVIPHFGNSFFTSILQQIEATLFTHGYRILLACSFNNPIKEFHDISALLERQVDGIIWAPVVYDEGRRAAELIMRQNCPLVFIDRKIPGINTDSVVVDDRHGALSAMRHLTSMGLRKIAYFGARLDSYVTQERRSGYLAGLREAGIEVRGDWMFRTGNDMIAGQSAVAQLLEQKEKVEAIFCFNDMLAVGTELELLNRGISIPEDIMLVGFGGVFESGIVRVPITSVHQDENALATAAAELLLTRMNNPTMKLPSVERVIPTTLIVRESTLRLPPAVKPASKSIAAPAAKPTAKQKPKAKAAAKKKSR